MKKISLVVILMAMLAGITYAAVRQTFITPSSKTVKRTLTVEAFNKLEVASIFEVVYEQASDNSYRVEVSAPDNLMQYVSVQVRREKLYLTFDRHISINGKSDIKVVVKSPVLKDVELEGASSFKASKINIPGVKFELEASSASTVKIDNLKAINVEIEASGASNIEVGKIEATQTEVEAKGASDVKLKNVSGNSLTAQASGASKIIVSGNVSQAALRASGASDVTASGLKAGSGSLKASGASNITSHIDNVYSFESNGASSISNRK